MRYIHFLAVITHTFTESWTSSSAAVTSGKSLLPPKDNPCERSFSVAQDWIDCCYCLYQDARALVRLQCDHVNRNLVPSFYRYLQAQDEDGIISGAKEYVQSLESLTSLFERANREVGTEACGLWNEGGSLSLTDVMAAPCLFSPFAVSYKSNKPTCHPGVFRATNVLKHYRAFELPPSDKFERWIARIFSHPAFKATASTEDLYLDSYERRVAIGFRRVICVLTKVLKICV